MKSPAIRAALTRSPYAYPGCISLPLILISQLFALNDSHSMPPTLPPSSVNAILGVNFFRSISLIPSPTSSSGVKHMDIVPCLIFSL